MKRFLTAVFAAALILGLLIPSVALAAARPVILLFETTKGDGATKELAESTTKAIRSYFRDSQRVEVGAFDRDSPTVLRAIMENNVTADEVASYASQAQRLEVAKTLAFQYAAGAEVSVKDSNVEVKLWVAKVDGTKNDKWEASSSAMSAGSAALDTDNAMQSAASSSVISVTSRAFTALPYVPEPKPTTDDESTAIGAPEIMESCSADGQ